MTMKNSLSITPLGAVALSNGESARPGESKLLKNLREREGALEVVGPYPALTSLMSDELLLAAHRCHDATHFITSRGYNIYHHGTLANGEYTSVASIAAVASSTPLHAQCIGEYVVIATELGSIYLLYSDSGYKQIDPAAIKPNILLHSTEAQTEYRQVDAISFGNTYTSWSALAAGDVQQVSASMRSAMKAIAGSAALSGKYYGAVWARCGVRLADDSYLWLGAPVLCGVEEAKKCTQALNVTAVQSGSSIIGINAFAPYLTPYRLGITPVSGFDERYDLIVKSVDILVTDAVAFYDPQGDVDYRCTTSTVSGSRTYTLVVNAPMVQYEAATMARLAECKWRVASSTTDFASLREGKWVAVNAPSSSEPLLNGFRTAALQYVQDSRTLDADVVRRCLQCVGTSVTHRHAITNGNTLMRGGITLLRGMPWSVASYFDSKSLSATACEVCTEVTIAGSEGGGVIVHRESLPFTPAALSPAIFFPEARATSISISIKGSGNTLTWSSRLMPMPQTDAAGCLANRLAANTLTDTGTSGFAPPAESISRQNRPGTIMMNTAGNPFAGTMIEALHSDSIVALAMVQKPISSNSFGKYPIYIFGNNGIYALPQTIGGTYGESRLLSRITIDAATLPCEAFDAIYFVSSDYHLMALRGAVTALKMRRCEASLLAWNQCERELWISLADGTTRVLMPSGRYYERSECLRQAIAHQGNSVAVSTNGALSLLSHESRDTATDVEWITHPIVLHSVMGSGLRGVTWSIDGECNPLTLQLNGARGAHGCGFRIVSARIAGTPLHPVYQRTVAPMLHSVRIIANGKIKAGSLILPPVIHASTDKKLITR